MFNLFAMRMKFSRACLLIFILFAWSCKKENVTPSYSNFKVLSVEVLSIPFKNAVGADWDFFDGPDVFFNMEDINGNVLYKGSDARRNNAQAKDLPFLWNFVNAHQITNIEVTQYVTVYDYDFPDANDRIGYIGFRLLDHKNGYPKTISKTTKDLAITIRGEWY